MFVLEYECVLKCGGNKVIRRVVGATKYQVANRNSYLGIDK